MGYIYMDVPSYFNILHMDIPWFNDIYPLELFNVAMENHPF